MDRTILCGYFSYEKKLVFIQDAKVSTVRPFNVSQVKPYFSPGDLSSSFLSDIHNSLESFKYPEEKVMLTETLDPSDDISLGEEISEAKKKEIRNLLERGKFKVILKSEVPSDDNVLPGRFVLSINSSIDGEVK